MVKMAAKCSEIFTILLWNINNLKISEEKQKIVFNKKRDKKFSKIQFIVVIA